MEVIREVYQKGHSKAISLPQLWLEAEERKGPFKQVKMELQDGALVIRPHRDNVEKGKEKKR